MHAPPATLIDLLDSLEASPARVVFPESDTALPHRDVPAQSRSLAQALLGEDVRQGEVVGLLVPAVAEFLPSFFGVLGAGAAVSVLPLPPIVTDAQAAARHLLPVVERARIRHVVVSGSGRVVGEALVRARPAIRLIDAGTAIGLSGGDRRALSVPRATDLAVVQFTSGSTSDPRGVVLTHGTVLHGVTAINERIRTNAQDVLVQWLPLFHDMGLVAVLCSLLTPCDAHLFNPVTFIRRPVDLLHHLAAVKGTITTGPNFSYDKLAAAAPDYSAAAGTGLEQWRLALNGGEAVQKHTVDSFHQAFTPLGVPTSTMFPCYGMAEAVLAVTLPIPGSPPTCLWAERHSLTPGSRVILSDGPAGGAALMSVGQPVNGMEVSINGPDGKPLPEDHLGEIRLRGPAVTSGYLHDVEATRRVMRQDRLHTGDVGFLHQGQLYIAGRIKDMIVVRGHNYYPEDVEQLVRQVPGVFKGRSVAVADPQTEHIVVVTETTCPPDTAQSRELTEAIHRTVTGALGLAAIRVITVPPRTLPRTTSGKWQRSLVRDLISRHDPGSSPDKGSQDSHPEEEPTK